MAGTEASSEGKIAGLYDLERTLGKGHFAVVKLARHVFTGERVAVKVIDKSKLDVGAAAQLLQEVRCMKLVQHPNVVRLYEVIDTQAKLYLILELGDGGDMFDHIMRHEGGLAEGPAKHYFAQVVHAISYCHRLHVVHRDLKPENVVFFREEGVVKLTDFGFSNCFQPGTMLTTSCGSLAYSAPEILLGDQYDAPAVDVWSLGVILYMLVCGQPPFQEANDSETLTMILDCHYVVPPHISSPCADLISRMLQRDPQCRASLQEIESHPWLQGVDPSPASRSLLLLTSHRRVSDQEHEIIIQAMKCGCIADRETIQEALEANRYNHITATYFLLAERILREQQERQSPGSSCLLDSLGQPVQSRHTAAAPPSDLIRPPSGETQRPPPLPASKSKSTLESFAEHSGKALFSFPVLGEDLSSDLRSCGQPIQALIRHSLIETPIAKSTPALQQISEEEEEGEGEGEEEEGERQGEGGKHPGLFRRRTSSLDQEQMSGFHSAKASLLFCRSLASHSKAGKSQRGAGLARPKAPGPGPGKGLSREATQAQPPSQAVHASLPKEGGSPQVGSGLGSQGQKRGPQAGSKGGEGGEGDGRHTLSQAEADTHALPLGGGGGAEEKGGEEEEEASVVTAAAAAAAAAAKEEEEEVGKVVLEGLQCPKEVHRAGQSCALREARMARPPADPGAGTESLSRLPKQLTRESHGGESLADNVIKLDPAKGKSANLKDRILQFPLCEKALAFRMRPTSKDSLLSLGRFNCCHVI